MHGKELERGLCMGSAYNCQDLSSVPSTYENLGVAVHIYHPSAGEAEKAEP